jgi:hypothetical protein
MPVPESLIVSAPTGTGMSSDRVICVSGMPMKAGSSLLRDKMTSRYAISPNWRVERDTSLASALTGISIASVIAANAG